MDTDSWLQLACFGVLMLASAYFSCAETAFSTLNNIRLRSHAQEGGASAKKALYITEHFDRAMSTILIGGTIANLWAAAVATLFAARVWGGGYVAPALAGAAALILFAGVVLPKAYAAYHNERIAHASAGLLKLLMGIFLPLSFVLTGIGRGIARLFVQPSRPTITEDELYDIIDNIDQAGVLAENQRELVQSALEFDDITVQNILTPRVDVAAINVDDSREEILAFIRRENYSRYPVYRGSIDNVIGVLQARRFLKRVIRGDSFTLKSLLNDPYFTHKRMPIDELLKDMRLKKVHMAIVADDYGGTMGIVTIEDILEELVGEIWDEDDEVVEEFKPLGGGRYEISGALMVADAFERMGLTFPEENQRYETVGAWALAHFDAIPAQGDGFEEGEIRVRIAGVYSNRIVQVVIQRLAGEEDT